MDNTENIKSEEEKPVVITETVLPKKKRKFSWTPARKAAFEKCIAARKQGIKPKVVPAILEKPVEKVVEQKQIKEESDSDDSLSLSSSSSESVTPTKKDRKKKSVKKVIRKQFHKINKQLEDMKKHLKKKPSIPRKTVKRLPPQEESDSDKEQSKPYSPPQPSYYFV